MRQVENTIIQLASKERKKGRANRFFKIGKKKSHDYE
jgi:hypothetical protein